MDDPKYEMDDAEGRRVVRVLVVDDSQDTARMMRVLLKRHGYQVKLAFAGREAIEVAMEFRPDIVLLDLTLPDMSGSEVVEELRCRPGFERTAFVAISGYGADRAQAHFGGHFVKPVDHDALVAHLARLTPQAKGSVDEVAPLPAAPVRL